MNAYDKKYDIRLARYDEIDEIMHFIKEKWNSDHILANNRAYFEYEYVCGNDVHFLLAKSREDNQIAGIIGYIPASKDEEYLDIWTVMWKVKEGVMPLLGMELLKRVKEVVKARASLGVGDNPKTTIRLLNKMTDYETGKMKHFYKLSKTLPFSIAKIEKPVFTSQDIINASVSVIKIESIEQLDEMFDYDVLKENIPYKDSWYISHRYFKHPVYSYQIYGLQEAGMVKALLITRVQEYNDSKVLRIIDYIGKQSLFAGLQEFFEEKLNEYEYIDFYVLGFDYQYIVDAGFIERQDEDTNIIPNYFYPFEQKNINIWCSGSEKGGLYCKGDSDQDRPNGDCYVCCNVSLC